MPTLLNADEKRQALRARLYDERLLGMIDQRDGLGQDDIAAGLGLDADDYSGRHEAFIRLRRLRKRGLITITSDGASDSYLVVYRHHLAHQRQLSLPAGAQIVAA